MRNTRDSIKISYYDAWLWIWLLFTFICVRIIVINKQIVFYFDQKGSATNKMRHIYFGRDSAPDHAGAAHDVLTDPLVEWILSCLMSLVVGAYGVSFLCKTLPLGTLMPARGNPRISSYPWVKKKQRFRNL